MTAPQTDLTRDDWVRVASILEARARELDATDPETAAADRRSAAEIRRTEARERSRRDADDDTRALLAEKLRDEAREAEVADMPVEER